MSQSAIRSRGMRTGRQPGNSGASDWRRSVAGLGMVVVVGSPMGLDGTSTEGRPAMELRIAIAAKEGE
jgi:hypothetical protein